MSGDPCFVFMICQVGAEPALKSETARQWPDFRFSYSRSGFVTYRLPAHGKLAEDFELRSVFARTYGFSLGKIAGDNDEEMAGRLWKLMADRSYDHLHVWQRDSAVPGETGFEPGVTPLAEQVGTIIAGVRPAGCSPKKGLPVNRKARPGGLVLDCVLVEPGEWWVGYHRAASMPSRWPGGVCPVHRRRAVVSRAYWKMTEALCWSRLPVTRGDRCVEIGSAPGGASQALLERGLQVMGIDPAEMDESVLAHPDFTHVKKRASDMKRRRFRGVKWLVADSNVAPKHTLDTVEAIVTHHDVHVRGMLLSLKLLDWELAEHIPEYTARVRSWGYQHVRVRQLAFNRREVCLAATRTRAMRRLAGRGRRSTEKP